MFPGIGKVPCKKLDYIPEEGRSIKVHANGWNVYVRVSTSPDPHKVIIRAEYGAPKATAVLYFLTRRSSIKA